MFRIDDRAGNVVTTVALFVIAATILYIARGAFLIMLLSLLFAYLLEPGGHVATASILRPGPEEPHLGDCTGLLDRDLLCWAAWGTS